MNTSFSANYRHGGLGFYAIILILIGLILAVFVFMPEYNEVQKGIYTLSCDEIRNQIQNAIDEYNIKSSKSFSKPNETVDLKVLHEKGYLREIKTCPIEGIYIFNQKGKVICSKHGKGQNQ